MTRSRPSLQLADVFKPRKHQKTAIKFLLEHANAGLLLKPGLGKTSSVLAALDILDRHGLVDGPVLVVAPLRVMYDVWPAEIRKWEQFNRFTYEILHGPDKDEALQRKADIYLVNYEGLDWLLDTQYIDTGKRKKDAWVDVKRFEKFGFGTLIADEIHKLKAYDTNRFRALKQVLHTFGRRWGLTGSPAPNGLMDLWAQAYILDMGRCLGEYITHYRRQYFFPDRSGYVWTLQEGGEERIYEKAAPLLLQMDDSVLDMPELVVTDIKLEMPVKVRELYTQFERDFLIGVDEGIVTAATAAAASNKIRQIASGGIYLDRETLPSGLRAPGSDRKTTHLHTVKVDALLDRVEELQGDPALVAYDFNHDYDRLKKAFPKAVFAADIAAKDFGRTIEAWNAGDVPLMFGHPKSIGHGLNLQGAGNRVIWHTLPWDFEDYDQFIRRVYRQGQKAKHVFVDRLIMQDTIEEIVAFVLASKNNNQQALFDGLKRLAKQRRK